MSSASQDRHEPPAKLDASNWRRWDMGQLRGETEQPTDARPGPVDAQTGAEAAAERRQALDAQHQQAVAEGREAGRQQGHEQGFSDGYSTGLEQGLAEGRRRAEQEIQGAIEQRSSEVLAPLATLIENLHHELTTLDDAIADDLADLALATGRQLAGDALKARPRQVVELVQGLLQTDPPLVGQQRLWLHPLDLKLVERHLGESLSAAGWSLRGDERLHRGGCRVAGEQGELDATWERRWDAVKAQVRRRSRTPTAD